MTFRAGPVPLFDTVNWSVSWTSVLIVLKIPFTLRLPSILASPETCNLTIGFEVPIPTFDITYKLLLILVFPATSSVSDGVCVLIPTLPMLVILIFSDALVVKPIASLEG